MAMKQNNFYLRWQKAAGAAKSEQRSRSIRALQSLSTKRLQNPAKKHSNIPL